VHVQLCITAEKHTDTHYKTSKFQEHSHQTLPVDLKSHIRGSRHAETYTVWKSNRQNSTVLQHLLLSTWYTLFNQNWD